ncbi:hypothetical protein INT45_006017 [Circinella minor]|uniref:PB1 domain-containing protein n=1 Tax=Circinella minor TaxID=1195481 RepID=A0A8H7SBB5_9FUNG|nr:hypothetical protein INT45_006017 [Circinella minor]
MKTDQQPPTSTALVFFILKPELDGIPEETRRFEVSSDYISYRELHQRVKNAFELKCKFNLTFDEHNTTITMTDDNDLNYLAQRYNQAKGGFVLNNEQSDPVVFMKIVILSSVEDDPDNDEEEKEWFLKAAQWIVNAGRVILIVAVPILHVFGPALAERLPPPYAQIVLAATAAARKMPELLGHPFSQALLAATAAFASTKASTKKESKRLSQQPSQQHQTITF